MRAVALTVLGVAAATACSVDDDSRRSRGIAAGDAVGLPHGGACDSGATRACTRHLNAHNGIDNCFSGVQTCVDGVWESCGKPRAGTNSAPLSASPCASNPCNPTCQEHTATLPAGGWSSSGATGTFAWEVGDASNVSDSVFSKTVSEPCAVASDCQMNTYCSDPISESCTHDVCATGDGLDLGCGACADEVCDANPKCCDKDDGQPSCKHSECIKGQPLTAGCSACADAVCAANSSCCSGWWNDSCVQLAESLAACGDICAPNPCSGQGCTHDICKRGRKLSASCDPCVASVCATRPKCCTHAWSRQCQNIARVTAGCEMGGPADGSQPCNHDPCSTGDALTAGCAFYVDEVCAADAACCDTAWDADCVTAFEALTPGGCPASWAGSWTSSCVDTVEDECGVCAAPPSGTGDCVTFEPGETMTACASTDLTTAISCDNTLAICNHGSVSAPAGVRIIHVPKDSGYFGHGSPPASISGAQTCTTTSPIPAGQCINLACGTLSEGREIMVNPPNGNPNHVTECNHGNNWGVFVGGSCGPPTCAKTNIKATLKPVNMFITVDKSGSMGGSRWTNTKKAFTAFFKDPGAADISVALEFFPHSGCYKNSSECGNASNCATPYVALDKLLVASAPTDGHEQKLITAFNKFSPGGMTPALLAFQGCHKWAADYGATHPDEQQVCVLVTDGAPNKCGGSTGPFVTTAKTGRDQHGVTSYGIGIVGAQKDLLEKIAVAGDGKSFFVGSAHVERDLLDALLAIRGDAVGCSVELPDGKYEPTAAVVSFIPGVGSTVTLSHVADMASCVADGWYLDDPANPKSIVLCPDACANAQSDPQGELDFTFPCQGQAQQTSYSARFEANCTAPRVPQWDYFSYDSTAPGQSSVAFEVRFADTEADLANANYKPLAKAVSSPSDTQVCDSSSGGALCPIDLFNVAGEAPDAFRRWIELQATLNPSGGVGPTVNDFILSHSCVDLE